MESFTKTVGTVYVIAANNGNIIGVYSSKEDAVKALKGFCTEIRGRYYVKDRVNADVYCYISEQKVKKVVHPRSNWKTLKKGDVIQLVKGRELIDTIYTVSKIHSEDSIELSYGDDDIIAYKFINPSEYKFLK